MVVPYPIFDIPAYRTENGVGERHIAKVKTSTETVGGFGYYNQGALWLEILQKLVNIEVLQRGDRSRSTLRKLSSGSKDFNAKFGETISFVECTIRIAPANLSYTPSQPILGVWGWISFEHRQGWEEKQWINAASTCFKPRYPNPGGFTANLRTGVVANIEAFGQAPSDNQRKVGVGYAAGGGLQYGQYSDSGISATFPFA